jgi:hypothetical protein
MAQSLEALIEHAIDYAGLFPPASLPLDRVLANCEAYLQGPHARFFNRLITPESIQGDREWAPNGAIYREALDPAAGEFAKIRTGGLIPGKIPSVSAVAAFIMHQARARRAFKATAGLHHPVRGTYALTYELDSPKAVMHGFLNVLLAAAFAWHGREDLVEPVLSEQDPAQFHFMGDAASWHGRELTTVQIIEARRDFIHSFGSCSFDEPIHDLQALGFLA